MSPQRKSQKSMGVTQCGSLLSKVGYPSVTGYSLSLSVAFKQFCVLFFAFLSGVSPNKLLCLSLCLNLAQPLSLPPPAPKPSLLPSHCSYLSLSSQGEPGPKGDPGEKSHWVSSSPALTSRCPPALDTQETIWGWGSPSNSRLQPGLPGESLARSQPLPTPSTLSLPSGQGQPYKQTYTLCLRHCLCLLSAAFAGQGDPAASSWVVWADPVQTACPAPMALPSKGFGFCSPVCKRKGSRKTISTQKRGPLLAHWP